MKSTSDLQSWDDEDRRCGKPLRIARAKELLYGDLEHPGFAVFQNVYFQNVYFQNLFDDIIRAVSGGLLPLKTALGSPLFRRTDTPEQIRKLVGEACDLLFAVGGDNSEWLVHVKLGSRQVHARVISCLGKLLVNVFHFKSEKVKTGDSFQSGKLYRVKIGKVKGDFFCGGHARDGRVFFESSGEIIGKPELVFGKSYEEGGLVGFDTAGVPLFDSECDSRIAGF